MQLDLNTPGALDALLAMHRRTFGDLRMEDGDGDGAAGGAGDGGQNDGGKGSDTGQSDRGFPENTPLAEMTDGQQLAYWKHQARKHEATAKARGDYDDLKAKAAEADRLRRERESESEKAIREARETAEKEANLRAAPRLVAAEFRAAAKGVLTTEQRDALLEDLDLTKFLTDKGEVDVDKVEKKVAALAPKKDERRSTPGTGAQGSRGGEAKSKGAAGAAEAQRRFAKSTAKQ